MTTPFDITEIIPTKYKAWVSLAGTILATLVPIVLGLLDYIPIQYAWVASAIHAVIGLLTTLGVYKAPFKPSPDTVLVHKSDVGTPNLPLATPENPASPANPLPPYHNPWLD